METLGDGNEFTVAIGTGMHPVRRGEGADFDRATVARLHARLDEFDNVRSRGEVESRLAYFQNGGRDVL